jgi:hypothetical protein
MKAVDRTAKEVKRKQGRFEVVPRRALYCRGKRTQVAVAKWARVWRHRLLAFIRRPLAAAMNKQMLAQYTWTEQDIISIKA